MDYTNILSLRPNQCRSFWLRYNKGLLELIATSDKTSDRGDVSFVLTAPVQ